MTNDETEPPNLEELLELLGSPLTPDEAYKKNGEIAASIKHWKKSSAISAISGLMTELEFHAYSARLDWLQRLVISKSNGKKKPTNKDIKRVLNEAFRNAGILRLEDPVEDFFCDVIPTSEGDHLIFTGHWESAAPYTQTVLEAFERLPEAPIKTDVLQSVFALLRLSTALAQRAKVDRRSFRTAEPGADISLASNERIKALSRRVSFTQKDLSALGVSMEMLAPFMLEEVHHPFVSNRIPGDTPLEAFPLISLKDGIMVANPGAISLAVRFLMLNKAKAGGLAERLLYELSVAQQRYAESTGFWPGGDLRLSPPDKHGLRSSVCSFSPGRYLHVIQVSVSLDEFPRKAFGAVTKLDAETNDEIVRNISSFWRFLKEQDDYRESATVLLLSGWGAAVSFAPDIQDAEALQDWRFIPISFADAALLGACKDGRLSDVWRILEQVELLEAVGYQIVSTNGMLNLIGNWRSTDGQLIPEQFLEIDPPCDLIFPIDDLFALRTEGSTNQDLRALLLPHGRFKIVQRREWDGGYGLKPAYGSLTDIVSGVLLGSVVIGNAIWWIEVAQGSGKGNRAWQFNVWNAILHWLSEAGSSVLECVAQNTATPPRYIRIIIQADAESASEDDARSLAGTPFDHLSFTAPSDEVIDISIGVGWNAFLHLPQNVAEFSLVTFVLEKILNSYAQPASREQVVSKIKEAIPSEDWRWLHVREAKKLIDRLASAGLVGDFRQIPHSAASLMKCGEIWKFYDRKNGHTIEGEQACGEFLSAYYESILSELIDDIRRFDRGKLVVSCVERYHACRHERERWQTSIRAIRSIRGESADDFAMECANAMNAVQRASKIVSEIAACEAPSTGGVRPAREDIDEMFARSLLLFGNGQLFSSIRAGLVPPKLSVSPAGDLLSDRSIFQRTLLPATQRLNTKVLDEAARAYRKSKKEEAETPPDKLPLNEDLRRAIECEYGCSAEAFVDLQFALVQIAEEQRAGVFVAKRSSLYAMLQDVEAFPKEDIGTLIERLTLTTRDSWHAIPEGYSEADLQLWRFDRPLSLIDRPILAISSEPDPLLVISPIFVSEAAIHAIGGLQDGHLQSRFWVSSEARAYAGKRADSQGREFEDKVVDVLNEAGFRAKARRNVTELLKMSAKDIGEDLGDVDVVAIDSAGTTIWAIEAKNLRLCRTEVEVAARMTDYRGVVRRDKKGRERPDKLMRHLKRTEFLRRHAELLGQQLQLSSIPDVRGLVVVDAPQPMNFHRLNESPDSETSMLDDLVRHIRQ